MQNPQSLNPLTPPTTPIYTDAGQKVQSSSTEVLQEESSNPVPNLPSSETTEIIHPSSKKNPLILVLGILLIVLIILGGVYLLWYNKNKDFPIDIQPTIIPTEVIVPTVPETSLNTYIGTTGFTFNYSDIGWTLNEETITNSVPGTTGSYTRVELTNTYDDYKIIIAYKPREDSATINLYGGAAGELVDSGSILFMGENLDRTKLIFQEKTSQVHYARTLEIERGNTAFSISILPLDFEESLQESNIEQAELVLTSFKIVPTTTNTSSKKYVSPILEDLSFSYPSDWSLKVEEIDDLGQTKIRSNLVTLSKDDHSLTIDISPIAVFGGETYCYKSGEISYAYSDNLVRVYKHNLSNDFSEKDFRYFSADSLDSKEYNSVAFAEDLNSWTPGVSDDSQYIACGSLDFTTVRKSIYSYSEYDNHLSETEGNGNSKVQAIVDIEGSYTSSQVDPSSLEVMDQIVKEILN